ncbi:MAG: hypothetical protein HFI87_02350 [Bacilli bacterium]|nr:hypothetical protein [Bacilli bacterium]
MIKNSIKKVIKFIKKINATFKLKKILTKTNANKLVLIGSPLHGNIGDHAISIAEMDFIKEITNKTVIEIPGEYYNLCTKKVINYIQKNDIIFITGGGFIGSLWPNEQAMVLDIITRFSNNKIIILPQTYFFENNDFGNSQLILFKEALKRNKNIYLFAREQNSYDFCLKNFNCAKQICLFPDVVLTLNYSFNNKYIRKGILLVLRGDKERVIDKNLINNSIDENKQVSSTTTVINKAISLKNRKKVFENKLNEFKTAELVITDRLHAMIFCAITGTPCIAFDNSSKKVSGVYQWIKSLDYIKFCDDPAKLNKYISKINIVSKNEYKLSQKYKNEITQTIREFIND